MDPQKFTAAFFLWEFYFIISWGKVWTNCISSGVLEFKWTVLIYSGSCIYFVSHINNNSSPSSPYKLLFLPCYIPYCFWKMMSSTTYSACIFIIVIDAECAPPHVICSPSLVVGNILPEESVCREIATKHMGISPFAPSGISFPPPRSAPLWFTWSWIWSSMAYPIPGLIHYKQLSPYGKGKPSLGLLIILAHLLRGTVLHLEMEIARPPLGSQP